MLAQKSKYRILFLYQLLMHESSPEHPLSTNTLIALLKERYDIDVNRITLGRDLKILTEIGLNIYQIKSSQHLFYYENPVFEVTELKLLVDAVSAARFIPQSQSQALIDKILPLTDANGSALLRRHILFPHVKTELTGGYYNVETINEAIDQNRKIRFQYFDYDVHKAHFLRHDGQFYEISPYALIWDGDCYYLVGSDDSGRLRHYRLDRILPQTLTLEGSSLPMPADLDLSDYCKSTFRMFATDQPQPVTLYCEQSAMKGIIDNFGTGVDTTAIDDSHFVAKVSVCASPTFFRWVFGWGGAVQIMEPELVVQEYQALIAKAATAAVFPNQFDQVHLNPMEPKDSEVC